MSKSRVVRTWSFLRANRWPVLGSIVAVLVLAGLTTWLTTRDGGPEVVASGTVTVSPSGDEVPRLGPIIVTFETPPQERDTSMLFALAPATEGSHLWVDDRTLLFQPAFPGLLRGASYTVRVDAQSAGLERDHTQTFTVEGQLTVDYVIPADGDVEVPGEAQILVQFNRSVAPLTLLSERGDAPMIEFDPPLAGEGEWLNTSLYRFIPERLQASTTYQLRIPAGLTSAADGVLEEDFTWAFSTYQPALAASDPADNTQFVGPLRPVVLTFNQPMELASVEAGVQMRGAEGDAVAVAFTWSADDTIVTLTPDAPLSLSTVYEVAVPAGLRGAAGGETQLERLIEFRTVDPPAVVSTTPADGATDASRWGVTIEFNNPVDIDSLEGRVSISGIDPDNLLLYPIYFFKDEKAYFGEGGAEPQVRGIDISARLKPSTNYTVSVAAGATDRVGQPLPAFSFSFTTGALPSSISFAVPSRIATYSASAEPILYFHATNRKSATFTLYPLTPGEAEKILLLGRIPNPSGSLYVPSGEPLRTWTEVLAGELDVVMLGSTSFSGGGPLPKGDYYVISDGDFGSQLMFSVVDTALITKLSNDELLVWALDYDTGVPLADVQVQAQGLGLDTANALDITDATATTDASGLASFPVPSPLDVAGRERSYLVRVDDQGHRGVASTWWRQGSESWQFGIPTEFFPQEYVGHLYTDRPIYRPGETVFYKGVVRLDDDANYSVPGASLPLELVIGDPQGNELFRAAVTLNEFGTFAGELVLPPEAATGSYWMSLQRERETYYWGVTSSGFRVAEFRVPEFQVSVETPRADYIDGELIEATATATFYFGGAVADAPVQWSVLASPAFIRPEGYERYSFREFDYYRTSEVGEPLRAEGQSTTDEAGTAAFSAPAVLEGDEGAQVFQISATVTDQNQQAVANSTTVTVHPAAFYAGIKPATYIATMGEPAEIDLVTVDTEGQPLPGRQVLVHVYERIWVTTKEQTPEGGRRYRSEPQDTLVETLTATTDDLAEATVTYTPRKAGTLRLVAEVTDEQGRTARSAAFLWVSGGQFASWRVRNDDVLDLIADKDSYEVGDVAEVLVPAPFEGMIGLVTIERGKIISRSTRSFPTTSERLLIPIEDHHVPNVFVGVVLYRPPTEEDPLPRYKVGYVELPVSTASRVLNVTINPDREQTVPGETVRYDIRVTDADGRGTQAEVSVAVVDKAVLALADEIGPDGLRAFWFQRGLAVQTASSLAVSIDRTNDVISEPEEEGGKGGGSDSQRLREEFRNTAFWAAQLVTVEDGTASVDVTMPDNLTTWRAQARAVSGDTMVGEGTSELLSTQPLLLRPALPRFLRVGDSATLRMLVRNATDAPTEVEVTLEAEGVDVSGDTSRSGTVLPDSSTIFEWPAAATVAGTSRLTFTAVGSGGLGDAVSLELPVYLDVTPETTATGGVVIDEAKAEAIYLPDYALRDEGSLEVSVQASLVGVLSDELPWFKPQSYESVVRVASRVIATLGARRAEGAAATGTLLDTRLESDIVTLIDAQRLDGGWAWCRYCSTNMTVTGWVLVALGEAGDAGRAVDPGVLNRATDLVLTYVHRPTDVEHPADPSEHSFLLYSLAKAGQDRHGSTMRAIVQQHRAELTNWGRAYLLLGLIASGADPGSQEVRTLLNDLTAAIIASANGNHWEDEPAHGSMHNSNVRITALVLRALTEIDPGHPLIEETVRWLVTARSAQRWVTTVERAQAIVSLGAYAEATGELAGDYDYAVELNGRGLLDGHFQPSEGMNTDHTVVPLAELPLGEMSLLSLLRDFDSPGRLYYGLNLRYVTPAREVEALNRGFAVSHEYSLLGEPDQRITSANLGDVVRVRVTVVVPADRKFVVVDDFLPAGLEPIDPQLKTVPPDLRVQLQEEQREAVLANAPDYFAPWFAWYFNPWDHVDVRDDRVTLFANELPQGVHEYVYFARATSPGDYFVAPVHAEETYFPEVFGRSDSGRFVIRPDTN